MESSNRRNNPSNLTNEPLLGFELDGRFKILEVIGSGGWGKVYRARHQSLKKDVAVKVIHRHHLQDEASLARLEQEAKALSRLDSPYVTKVMDYGLNPVPYIAMEYFPGQSLSQTLRNDGAMRFSVALDLFLQICEGLNAAHAIGIIHRDLKPANILVRSSARKIDVRILDFGLAKLLEGSSVAEKLTATGEILGSPAYMAPEQWNGNADARSDIYSLGCIMYEVLSGKPPFTAQYALDYLQKHLKENVPLISAANPNSSVPVEMEKLVRKCMAKAPAHRYKNAQALKQDLEKIRDGKAVGSVEEIWKRCLALSKVWLPIICAIFALLALYVSKDSLIEFLAKGEMTDGNFALANGDTNQALSKFKSAANYASFLQKKTVYGIHSLRMLVEIYEERQMLKDASVNRLALWKLVGDPASDPPMMQKIAALRAEKPSATKERSALMLYEDAVLKFGPMSLGAAMALDLLGQAEVENGKFDAAIGHSQKSLEIKRQILEPDDLQIVCNLDLLVEAFKRTGQRLKAEQMNREAILIKQSAKVFKTATSSAQSHEQELRKGFSTKDSANIAAKAALDLEKDKKITAAAVAVAAKAKLAEQEKKKRKQRQDFGKLVHLTPAETNKLGVLSNDLAMLASTNRSVSLPAARVWAKIGSSYNSIENQDDNSKMVAEYWFCRAFNYLESRHCRDEEIESYLMDYILLERKMGRLDEANSIYGRWYVKGRVRH